ncbi:potassium-transporting ATPase subunit KdpA [Crenobacter cavernae]|uniref:Potassium-transporting ATPase potassium-binding subunit n=1 Tax=Crenobacter cavernae TaxID=2290923 RepID=A0ABY0FG73_9NEIS|nr:potassium-transporting ATPase subunit KdpA [Crenobacter cavernae]RXZ45099.1 potassium-transporting ATPase subunit KdpA [Crenobacter cavernae]
MKDTMLLQSAVYLGLLALLAWPLGAYMKKLFAGEYRWQARLEAPLWRAFGVKSDQDMPWHHYAIGLIAFNVLGLLFLYALQRLQGVLPLNPQGFSAISPDSAFNTAISFVANTNWQGYAGESMMSHLTQMLGLTVQNFLSAATGIAVAIALIRGFVRRESKAIGNVWVDLTRATLGLLLPIATVIALALASQGVIQNLDASKTVPLLEPLIVKEAIADAAGTPLKDSLGQALTRDKTVTEQTLSQGPIASQEAIKMLGTNGGGFFNANSAHPYENPNALSNLIEMLAIFLIPAALCFTFGHMVGDRRQGVAIFAAMTLLFVGMLAAVYWAESSANPILTALGVDGGSGNMEGKEARFGIAATSLFATITTAASCGAVNAMHDSLMPIGGMVTMLQMQLGEVVFGGVGSGFYGMLLFAIVAVFVSGLMIGRTPEYLGKKIGSFDIRMVMIALLATPFLVLLGTGIAVSFEAGLAGLANPGAHGFSEILYAFSSAANNNGSAFAGLSANTPFYNTLLGLAMWFGRFAIIVPVLALAGSLAAKRAVPVTSGTLATHTPLFVVLLVGAVLVLGALTYLPALALGPVVEHLSLFGIR